MGKVSRMNAERPALHILVVDDDDADALMITEALAGSDTPAEVDRVSDGVQALEYLYRRGQHRDSPRPDLVLLDLNMPRMNGREVLAEIKNDDSLKAIPVVVLTTSGAAPDIMGSYQNHANAYVTKPLDLEAFEDVVRMIDRFYRDTAILPSDR
jgi:CheY-like chemotaxis protein